MQNYGQFLQLKQMQGADPAVLDGFGQAVMAQTARVRAQVAMRPSVESMANTGSSPARRTSAGSTSKRQRRRELGHLVDEEDEEDEEAEYAAALRPPVSAAARPRASAAARAPVNGDDEEDSMEIKEWDPNWLADLPD